MLNLNLLSSIANPNLESEMPITKKLEKLLLKYKKANQARITAYARRSRAFKGTYVPDGFDGNGWQQWRRVHKTPVTDELKAELDANIETARLYKLKVSAELRTYCKKKKYHIQWGTSNQIKKVLTHTEWSLRRRPQKNTGDTLLRVLHNLKLSTQPRYFY